MTIALILGGIVIVGGLFYTLKIGKAVNVRNSELDEEIHSTIRKNWISLNPVFLAYIIAIGAILVYIAYLAVTR
ncbi:hypothetical protein [Neobacillus vireti]|uniref:Uncharacterized protein n=1 Tax=Neobacillus vireti LMG 21834 TaxID=1131730 RepID=A0AB94IU65_9BACI|nr:hypothetical protein [Neobacillus vireti]ETI70493.1 hypothetical protein BAVI_02054 [Neobacillus vireti LMG 21834]KLT19907.1 hypothetical protein AA980_04980 [Neobacillus vireti]